MSDAFTELSRIRLMCLESRGESGDVDDMSSGISIWVGREAAVSLLAHLLSVYERLRTPTATDDANQSIETWTIPCNVVELPGGAAMWQGIVRPRAVAAIRFCFFDESEKLTTMCATVSGDALSVDLTRTGIAEVARAVLESQFPLGADSPVHALGVVPDRDAISSAESCGRALWFWGPE